MYRELRHDERHGGVLVAAVRAGDCRGQRRLPDDAAEHGDERRREQSHLRHRALGLRPAHRRRHAFDQSQQQEQESVCGRPRRHCHLLVRRVLVVIGRDVLRIHRKLRTTFTE